MGLISSAGGNKAKGDKPFLRITRSFPFFGRRTAMLYFPQSVGSGFSYLPLTLLVDSRVFVEPSMALDKNAMPGADLVQVFEVRSTTMKTPIIVMQTHEQAVDVVRRLSIAISPNRMKWVWGILAVLAFVAVFMPSGGGTPALSPLSINTPIAPRATAPGVSMLPSLMPKSPVVQTPAPAGINFPAPANLPNQKPADPNDPFGLKITPVVK